MQNILYFLPMILGGIEVQGRAVMAPMAGITDSSYRVLCRQQGAAIVFSEMISSEGLIRENKRTTEYLVFKPEERPIGIQLFGANPDVMAEAAKQVEMISPDFIDLNFGCPVKKVIKKGAGAAILKDMALLRQITMAVVKATSLAVTVKIRSGWNESMTNAVEVACILEDCGVAAVTIHPRFQSQLFRGRADWKLIEKVKKAVSIPIIGNGDLDTPDDARRMLDETGCDLVMIGRAALGNPWIFRQINHYLEHGAQHISPVSLDERLNTCITHLELLVSVRGEKRGVREMRKHLAWYIKGLPRSSTLRAILVTLNEVAQVKQTLINYFQELKQTSDIHYD